MGHNEEQKDDVVPGNDTKKKKKNKKNANKIELNMVDKRESATLCQYFAMQRIEQKKAGMESPDRRNKNNHNANEKKEEKEEDEATDEDANGGDGMEEDSEGLSGSDVEYTIE